MGGTVICQADARRIPLVDGSVHCCVTSPPYWGLRDYGLNGEGIGLEKTPEEYVENIVAVFREVWRVLRKDGTLWLNLGDCYASAWPAPNTRRNIVGNPMSEGKRGPQRESKLSGALKEKDLVGVPWRVAFALQADGWYLRSDIIWHKPNPMPESVTDRPTKSHEYLFLLSKRPRYYYDAQAIAEPAVYRPGADGQFPRENEGPDVPGQGYRQHRKERESKVRGEFSGKTNAMPGREAFRAITQTRNRRDVWTIPTSPYKGAHFATFPPKLVEPCVLAGTSAKGVCPECGAPWERIVERKEMGERNDDGRTHGLSEQRRSSPGAPPERGWEASHETTGWRPTCDHGADWRVIETPTGERSGEDPTMETGRAGMNRPRGPNEGRRSMYVWEQRGYAAQLRNSPHRPAMEQEAGSAFDHYIRTDESGARPLPPDLLERWLESGWITQPDEPAAPPEPEPAVVLDPFCGSGTVGQVCRENGRRFVGLDLSWKYLHELAYARAELGQLALA